MSGYWLSVVVLLAAYIAIFNKKVTALPEGKINWTSLESIGITLSTYFGGQLLASILILLPLTIAGWDTDRISNWIDNSTTGQFVLILAIQAISLYLLYAFLKRRKANFGAIGLINPKLIDVGYALVGFVVYFVFYIAVVTAVKSLVPDLNLDQKQQIGFEQAAGGQLGLVFISLVLLPPFVEEVIVRGFLYSGLKKGLPKIWAVIITSCLFAAAHLQFGGDAPLLWIAAIDTFVLSLVLIYLRDKTGRLWAPIGLHVTKNFVAFLVLFVFTSS